MSGQEYFFGKDDPGACDTVMDSIETNQDIDTTSIFVGGRTKSASLTSGSPTVSCVEEGEGWVGYVTKITNRVEDWSKFYYGNYFLNPAPEDLD